MPSSVLIRTPRHTALALGATNLLSLIVRPESLMSFNSDAHPNVVVDIVNDAKSPLTISWSYLGIEKFASCYMSRTANKCLHKQRVRTNTHLSTIFLHPYICSLSHYGFHSNTPHNGQQGAWYCVDNYFAYY